MRSKDKEILAKIIMYAEKAIDYLGSSSLEMFHTDDKTAAACALNIIQIGELANRLSDEFVEVNSHIPLYKIRGMRNRIVHDYEGMLIPVVYNVIKESLPQLISDIKNIIKNGSTDAKG